MTRPPERPFDLGLQAERTALSWQRTTLSFAIASLVGARLLLDVINILSYAIATIGLVITAALFLIGHRRYRTVHTLLVSAPHDRIQLASAIPLFAWALIAFLLALVGLAFAVVAGLR